MQQSKQKLKLALIGDFNAGKTTLINAMLNTTIFETGILPKTKIPTQITYANLNLLKIEELDQNVIYHNTDQLKHYQHQSATEAASVASMTVMFNHPFLKDVILYDTPGFNATHVDDQEKTKSMLSAMDVIFWVISIEQLVTDQQLKLIKALTPMFKGRSVCLMNKYDLLNDGDEIKTATQHIHEMLKYDFDQFYMVSGYQAMKGRSQDVDQINQIKDYIFEKKDQWISKSQAYWISVNEEKRLQQLNLEKSKIKTIQKELHELKIDLKSNLQNTNQALNKAYLELTQAYQKLENTIISDLYKNPEIYYIVVEDDGWFGSSVDYKKRVCLSIDQVESSNELLFQKYENLFHQFLDQIQKIFSNELEYRNKFYEQNIEHQALLKFIHHPSSKEKFNLSHFFDLWHIAIKRYDLTVSISCESSNLEKCAYQIKVMELKRKHFSSSIVKETFDNATIFQALHQEIYDDLQELSEQSISQNEEEFNRIDQAINDFISNLK